MSSRGVWLALLVVGTAACRYDTAGDGELADAAAEPGPDAGRATPLHVDVEAVEVAPAVKGDALAIAIDVRNLGTTGGAVTLRPLLTADGFADFIDVPLGDVEVIVDGGGTARAELAAGPFVDDAATGKRYALGRGDYRITAVVVSGADDREYDGGAFAIGESDVVFTAVVYDQAYLDRIGYAGGAEQYMIDAFTREAHLFTPSAPGSDDGGYEEHAGGFDAMMGVRQQFRAVAGLAASEEAGGFCEQIGAYAREAFGLTRDWDVDESAGATDREHHGFDLLVGLTPDLGGGAACGWLGVQVSGLFDFDLSLDRAQIIAVHETGHLFGAPHCDPLQGYVMCSGEKHPRYQADGVFVWHRVSREAMANRWR